VTAISYWPSSGAAVVAVTVPAQQRINIGAGGTQSIKRDQIVAGLSSFSLALYGPPARCWPVSRWTQCRGRGRGGFGAPQQGGATVINFNGIFATKQQVGKALTESQRSLSRTGLATVRGV
jgi:hypothetical protein